MTPARFLETREPAWSRVAALLDKTKARGTHALSEEELHGLTRLYPAIAVDVARARALHLDPRTQQRLNLLAIRAHGLLYRKEKVPVWSSLWRFFAQDYPRLFRRLGGFVALAVTLFVVTAVGTYATVVMHPTTAYVFVPGPIDSIDGQDGLSGKDMSDRFRRMARPPMAAGIMTNNISVAFNAFALGITFGLGTCYLLLYNGMMLGGFAAHFANHGLQFSFWTFILPHGALEIFAILLAAAAGLRLGLSLAVPGALTRSASLRAGARDAVFLVLGTVPMFVVAGMVEGFITPSDLPGVPKLILGLTLLALTLLWLLLAGRSPRSQLP